MAIARTAADDEFLTVEEAAALLGVKPATLYAYVSRGRLRSYKQAIGRNRLYRRTDILRLLAVYPDEGLEDPVLLPSAITALADGAVRYRGYALDDLVQHAGFEAVTLLLWEGERPDEPAIAAFRAGLAAVTLPEAVAAAVRAAGALTALARLRLGVSLLAAHDPESEALDEPAVRRKAVRLLGALPALVAAFAGASLPRPDRPGAPWIASRLLAPFGGASEPAVKALDRALVVLADHELNASTLAARLAASMRGDLYAAVTAALATLDGPLHGGTFAGVAHLWNELRTPAEAEAFVQRRRAAGSPGAGLAAPIPGFGHALHPIGDPRAPLLRALLETVDRQHPTARTAIQLDTATQRAGGPPANADFYASALFQVLGLPPPLHPAIFAVARCAGWIAHIFEQYRANRLIRPRARYTGPAPRRWQDVPTAAQPSPLIPWAREREAYWICGSD